jgi:AraC-like DNA-binding protein
VKVFRHEARWAATVVNDLKRRGRPVDGILREVGLTLADIADPQNAIPYRAYIGLIERAATALGDASYGLRLGTTLEIRDTGLLGFLALNSPTLMQAFTNFRRYHRVVGEGLDAMFEQDSTDYALRYRETDPALRGLRHNAERAATLILRCAREITDTAVMPVRVDFTHEKPNERIDYTSFLGCPVRFRAEWDAIVFSNEVLRLPVVGADKHLLALLEQLCRRILGAQPEPRDVLHDVRRLIIERLPKGSARIDHVAKDLAMSSRTLERRLAQRGQPFSGMVDEVRSSLARQYLENTDFRLEQIAYLLGYSEAPAFARAFKRWFNTTPVEFRRRARSVS